MVAIDLKSLVGRMNALTRRQLEAAAGLTLSRTHYNGKIDPISAATRDPPDHRHPARAPDRTTRSSSARRASARRARRGPRAAIAKGDVPPSLKDVELTRSIWACCRPARA
jgi:hypothetical protein